MLVREAHRLRRDVDDVGVLRDRPERLVARRLEVRDRRLGPQLRPHRVGIAVAREPRGIDEVQRIDGTDCLDTGGHGREANFTPGGNTISAHS